MKVKNLLFGTMIALAFTACSNNDDPINNNPQATTDGTQLEVSTNFIQTKAGDSGYEVYVFDATGAYEAKGAVDSPITLKAEGQKTFVIIDTNHMPTANPNTIADLQTAVTYGDAEQSDASSSRNSCVYTVDAARGVLNVVGYDTTKSSDVISNPNNLTVRDVKATASAQVYLSADKTYKIPVYRNVAKIVLNTIVTATKTTGTSTIVYKDPKVTVESVFILNARANAYLIPSSTTTGWWLPTEYTTGNAFVNGASNEDWAAWWADANTDTHKDTRYVKEAQTAQTPQLVNLYKNSFTATEVSSTAVSFANKAIFYAYENSSSKNPTLLVVKGKFSYTGNNGTVVEENRYWTLPIGITSANSTLSTANWSNYADFGYTAAPTITGLRRNVQYVLDLTITGPGSVNPLYPGSDEVTYLEAAVKLVDWGYVSQSGRID